MEQKRAIARMTRWPGFGIKDGRGEPPKIGRSHSLAPESVKSSIQIGPVYADARIAPPIGNGIPAYAEDLRRSSSWIAERVTRRKSGLRRADEFLFCHRSNTSIALQPSDLIVKSEIIDNAAYNLMDVTSAPDAHSGMLPPKPAGPAFGIRQVEPHAEAL